MKAIYIQKDIHIKKNIQEIRRERYIYGKIYIRKNIHMERHKHGNKCI